MPWRSIRSWWSSEEGSMSALSLVLLPVTLMIGGLALDVANAVRVRTHLQVTADAAAHAALYTRESGTVEEARATALEVIGFALPETTNGAVVRPEDISFGHWDGDARSFTPDPTSRDAVRVDLARTAERQNPVGTWLLRLAGFGAWDITRTAVFETYRPGCLREGFIAERRVDMQSNNSFHNGFCIHSNDHVEFNQNNVLEDGVVVSMPDIGTLVIPASGFASNVGLLEALRNDTMNIRILRQLPEIIDTVGVFGSPLMPDYIGAAATVQLRKKNAKAEDFVPGRIHRMDCSGGGTLQIASNTVLQDIVLTTNCSVKFGSGVTLQNVVVATTSTDANSIKAASGLQIGRDDDCAPDGGSQILTLGGVSVPANLALFGGQIIAAGDVGFAARADGLEGASVIAGGEIDGTSNATMGLCGDGMERNFEVDYFRLVL